MDEQLLKLAVPTVLALAGFLAVLSSLIWNVSGTWERVPDESLPKGVRPERLKLGQFGPFVRGRRDVPGGWQEYAGTMWGRSLKLTRRDFGVDNLKRQNFPDVLAQKLSGDVFAELKLELTDGGLSLEGTFMPQKIDFLLAPPRITARYWLPEVPRIYRLVSPVEDDETASDPAVAMKDAGPA